MVSGTPDHAALSGGILCCAEQMPTLPDRAPGSDDPRISREYTPSPDNGIYQSLSGALRLWPHRLKGEGHFAARLQKARTSHPQDRPGKPAFPDRRAERIPYQQLSISYAHAHKKKREKRTSSLRADGLKEYQDFIADHLTDRHIKKGSSCRLERYGDNLFQLPGLAPSLSGIKVLRPGLHLGLIRKNRFEPAHALARALTADQVRRSVSCSLEDAIRYLAGQTLSCGHDLKGWTLVCYQGHSLGWGKAQGGTLKNHYPKGLRRRTG